MIENFKTSRRVKYSMLALGIPIGLILSGVLAHLNIDYTELLKIFNKNIFNPKTWDELAQVARRWYIISGIIGSLALVLPVIYSVCSRKKDSKDITWGQIIFATIDLICISQIVLPMLTFIIAMVICLVYSIFSSSILLKNILGYVINCFILMITKICMFLGITLTYSEFIGPDRYAVFLTIVTFLALIPYILPFLLRVVKKIIQAVAGKELVSLFFKPFEMLISITVLRYATYIFLFFISIFAYIANISQPEHILFLVKEALLEFVLLDTVIYSIISNLKDTKINHERKNMKRYYISFKYDLEFVLSAITMHNLRNKEMHVRIKFSLDINRNLNGGKQKNINNINELLIDISTNYYKIEILEQKIKEVLHSIIDLIG